MEITYRSDHGFYLFDAAVTRAGASGDSRQTYLDRSHEQIQHGRAPCCAARFGDSVLPCRLQGDNPTTQWVHRGCIGL